LGTEFAKDLPVVDAAFLQSARDLVVQCETMRYGENFGRVRTTVIITFVRGTSLAGRLVGMVGVQLKDHPIWRLEAEISWLAWNRFKPDPHHIY
jgi:hypothetical protein